MFRSRKQAKWATEAAAYSVNVLDWQITVAKNVPSTIHTRDKASRTIFLAAESMRSYLEVQRQRLLITAVKLGIDSPDLPEAAWPDRKPPAAESLYDPAQSV